ncbi:hypothetical protein VRB95_06170 [Erwinia aphidicola]|jgi:hypothetical protein|uniref:Biofilm development protein YmgB/AriR n=1 Tax=Erwinia aphidicola TaxID=68334 RepID=A0ABU8DL77_ERWAP|nr:MULTISPECIES: hypothetical protein [Erwinia]KMV71708.1 hypothetical protein AI28_24120 [bacteria symbiont BFo1 of Frankliniella occidentalis]PIJ54605.1 hypothetical protein BOM23_21060 [Erwinia sp. OLMDLW33]VTT26916.1 Uncharacterised protein [Klebsiella pneumoniae]KYP85792.1 hypothetical protein WB66_06310 [bacteria symbiont BFo1 of Frankliniella occidentalis]KYP91406.1 hypothetical protein WB91_05635 [bacteria symbiont BFo1 of Frankliniella occidentalis]
MPDKDPVVERLSLEVVALRNIVQMLIAYGNVPTGGKLNKYLEKVAEDVEHRDGREANKAIADVIRTYIR